MKISILGLSFDNLTKNQLLSKINQALDQNRKLFLTTPYSESVVRVQNDKKFLQILNSADFSLADGVGVLWAAKYLSVRPENQIYNTKILRIFYELYFLSVSLLSILFYPKFIQDPIPEKISGSDFIWDLSRLASERGERVFLLGGFDDVAEKTAKLLKYRFPKLQISGVNNANEKHWRTNSDMLIREINDVNTDFLFVALGPVKQERWIAENLKNLNIKLAIGLGGTFDYISGKKPKSPNFLRLRGLEWAWRLISQPWRIIRITKGVFGLIYYCYREKISYNKQ